MSNCFDLKELHDAIDTERCNRGLTWPAVTREISRNLHKPIATLTIKSLAVKATAEGDGVLQALVWLNRNPESFVPGLRSCDHNMRLPKVPKNKVLRWHAEIIYDSLEEKRLQKKMTWQAVADEIGFGVTATYLTGKKNGGRMSFPNVMHIIKWLNRPAVQLMIIFDW